MAFTCIKRSAYIIDLQKEVRGTCKRVANMQVLNTFGELTDLGNDSIIPQLL